MRLNDWLGLKIQREIKDECSHSKFKPNMDYCPDCGESDKVMIKLGQQDALIKELEDTIKKRDVSTLRLKQLKEENAKLLKIISDTKGLGFYLVDEDSGVSHRDLCRRVERLLGD